MKWTEKEFLEQIDNPVLHKELIDAIRALPGVELRFMDHDKDSVLPGYKVYVKEDHILWVYVPSKVAAGYKWDMYVSWGRAQTFALRLWHDLWRRLLVNPDSTYCSLVYKGLEEVGVAEVCRNLQVYVANVAYGAGDGRRNSPQSQDDRVAQHDRDVDCDVTLRAAAGVRILWC